MPQEGGASGLHDMTGNRESTSMIAGQPEYSHGDPHAMSTSMVQAEPVTAVSKTGAAHQYALNVGNMTRGRGVEVRAGSQPGSARGQLTFGPTTKVAQDSFILTNMRRQMETLEDKLSGQMNRVQQQTDRLCDAALNRVDSKMSALEALQPKLDRRLAELSGSCKATSDEMNHQIRRVEAVESKLWEWRHQLEEEMRHKIAELDKGLQQVSSGLRVHSSSTEDVHKRHNQRLINMEQRLEDRAAHEEDHNQSLLNLHHRLSQMEELRSHETALCLSEVHTQRGIQQPDMLDTSDKADNTKIEMRFADTSLKIDRVQQESHDLHTRVEHHEERLKQLRTLVENKDENHRWLRDRVERTDWEGRFKEIQNQINDMNSSRHEHNEKLELMRRKVQDQEGRHEELERHLHEVRGVQENMMGISEPVVQNDMNGAFPAGETGLLVEELQLCKKKLDENEAKFETLSDELQALHTQSELGPRVSSLIEELKQIAPRMINQEQSVRELHEKVGRLEVEKKWDKPQESGKTHEPGKTSDASDESVDTKTILPKYDARIGRLEVEVARLVHQIEGEEEVPPIAGNAENQEAHTNQGETTETIRASFRMGHRASATE